MPPPNAITRFSAPPACRARRARTDPNLQLVSAPTLSICGIRYLSDRWDDLNELNRRIHRRMVQRGRAIPSTTLVNGTLAIRPCFVGARTTLTQADELVDEVLAVGREVVLMNKEAAG